MVREIPPHQIPLFILELEDGRAITFWRAYCPLLQTKAFKKIRSLRQMRFRRSESI